MKEYVSVTDKQLRHVEQNNNEFRRFDDHDNVEPKVVIFLPTGNQHKTTEKINSPELMLQDRLDAVQMNLNGGSDYIPQVRVEFGTGQIAMAYGCEAFIPEDSPVCSKGHVLENLDQIENLAMPSLTAGWFEKCYEFTEFFLENKPDFVGLEYPDLQGTFNNAHLVRGNDVLFDFYDDPEKLQVLFEKITDYQIAMNRHYKKLAGMEENCFYDWGVLWRGNTRIADCSLHMLSTEFYNDHIKVHDQRMLREVGGGRVHYCGEHDNGLINSLCGLDGITGLDLDGNLHDPWQVAEKMPKHVPLLVGATAEHVKRILRGDVPKKNNVIYVRYASTIEEAQELYKNMKKQLKPF